MAEKALKQRSLLSDLFKWNLEDIYPTDDDWEKEFSHIKKELAEISKLKGTLGSCGDVIFDALEKIYDLQLMAERLFVYAKMRLDEDNGNSDYQAFSDRATSILVEVESTLSFVHPEILKISDKN